MKIPATRATTAIRGTTKNAQLKPDGLEVSPEEEQELSPGLEVSG